ncbi:CDP-archaeol synthase [Halocynthiibacter sp. C4]|uniref:phosphatidate cytidylyltransferase n=1 Tax=Halocynthiibacter sp. C4 TaxID=2992758 RepID=UPI00237AFDFB|nr:CDP-archaeol synthase [Halocynthiibacter sp. C4]MDE0589650.1 CDP-archaeol synthase [Halocynthiibacter sp. C4]
MNELPKSKTNWSDLAPRTLSAIAMVIIAGGATWAGGIWFVALLVGIAGAMLWELWRMMRGALAEGRDRARFVIYAVAIVIAAAFFIYVRLFGGGLQATVQLFAIVVITDVLGYFAGRTLGGPKFWPRISPKKTWSGTVAGWLGAATLGISVTQFETRDIVHSFHLETIGTIILFIALSFAAQMGDIVESSYKRRYGIKDSSNLIPGHGGFMDRFDGMVGLGFVGGIAMTVGSLVAGG